MTHHLGHHTHAQELASVSTLSATNCHQYNHDAAVAAAAAAAAIITSALQAHQLPVLKTWVCPFVLRLVPSASQRCLAGTADTPGQTLGIDDLIQEIVKCVPVQPAAPSGSFKFAIDHCFAIRGQGTILTGTALAGTAKVGDALELPELKVSCHTACCSHCLHLQTCLEAFSASPSMIVM